MKSYILIYVKNNIFFFLEWIKLHNSEFHVDDPQMG